MAFALIAGVWPAACGGGANGTGGAGAGGGPGNQTCQALRLCALDCGDEGCVSTCKQRGTADAQAAFQGLFDCTRTEGGCASPNDLNCLCNAQCLQDPPCAVELDACVGATSDSICEVNCH